MPPLDLHSEFTWCGYHPLDNVHLIMDPSQPCIHITELCMKNIKRICFNRLRIVFDWIEDYFYFSLTEKWNGKRMKNNRQLVEYESQAANSYNRFPIDFDFYGKKNPQRSTFICLRKYLHLLLFLFQYLIFQQHIW